MLGNILSTQCALLPPAFGICLPVECYIDRDVLISVGDTNVVEVNGFAACASALQRNTFLVGTPFSGRTSWCFRLAREINLGVLDIGCDLALLVNAPEAMLYIEGGMTILEILAQKIKGTVVKSGLNARDVETMLDDLNSAGKALIIVDGIELLDVMDQEKLIRKLGIFERLVLPTTPALKGGLQKDFRNLRPLGVEFSTIELLRINETFWTKMIDEVAKKDPDIPRDIALRNLRKYNDLSLSPLGVLDIVIHSKMQSSVFAVFSAYFNEALRRAGFDIVDLKGDYRNWRGAARAMLYFARMVGRKMQGDRLGYRDEDVDLWVKSYFTHPENAAVGFSLETTLKTRLFEDATTRFGGELLRMTSSDCLAFWLARSVLADLIELDPSWIGVPGKTGALTLRCFQFVDELLAAGVQDDRSVQYWLG